MNSRERARQWLQDNGIEESLTTEDSLTFEFEEHAAEEIAKRKCENCTYFKYDDECHVPSSDEEDALGEKLSSYIASVLPEYCCPQFKEKKYEFS